MGPYKKFRGQGRRCNQGDVATGRLSAMRQAKDLVNPHGLQLLAEPLCETFRFLQIRDDTGLYHEGAARIRSSLARIAAYR